MNQPTHLPANDRGDDSADTAYRQPPHNSEAEQALLGAMLVNNEAAQQVSEILTAEHFYEPVHGRIYDAIQRLVDRNQIADPVRLRPFFEHDEALAEVGGAQYLMRLASAAATILNARDYAEAIYDLALRRKLISIGQDIVLTAYDADVDDSGVGQIETAEQKLFTLAEEGKADDQAKPFHQALAVAVGNIEKAYQDPDKLSGVTTGLQALNDRMGGLHPSDLVILAGRPAMGKTALATNIAFNAARRFLDDKQRGVPAEASKGAVVAFFSLEMSADQLAARILADRAGVPSEDMRRGNISKDQFDEIARASFELEQMPFFIDDTPALSIAGLRTRARRLKRRNPDGLGLIVVDYLQLLRGTGRGTAGESRVQEISEITRGLKGLAKELHVPVLALSQLSRMVEQRENKRPMLSDLRESGSIEQDADMVMFVYREEYYKEKEKPTEGTDAFLKWQDEMQNLIGKAEVIVGKQRHGPTGTAHLSFLKESTRFTDLADDSHLPDRF
ncbi:primary replicative DNA helicase [Rhodothalassium salexigens DSM 2132]|uniref:Replicative DNA helicase n=1 Tax=Rhodothalassium salexigens DSM 2132 TaxID=1188247 RepID=A0A4R2PTI4_RHOSA|nr:replicative DNA helicase [Rhodothalassium salexigens]MBB4210280.1 replicative DNA helicase [Rhodothalassium salexigens DSM 2132]MBK1638800.1 replicative DNA helicase [Rhodothalassium salexigens DSM 2132]MBK5920874.1 replicative DNA helicase [Rhodothalassium salexigens]TCP38444.1 primary replicative DNA helicase [Rhodothalassium salexigens DSM 2132]